MKMTDVRPSGYVARFQETWYGALAPVYDLFVRWCFMPLGGERRVREWIAASVGAEPGQVVLSLCCGTGTTDRVLGRAGLGMTHGIRIDTLIHGTPDQPEDRRPATGNR